MTKKLGVFVPFIHPPCGKRSLGLDNKREDSTMYALSSKIRARIESLTP